MHTAFNGWFLNPLNESTNGFPIQKTMLEIERAQLLHYILVWDMDRHNSPPGTVELAAAVQDLMLV